MNYGIIEPRSKTLNKLPHSLFGKINSINYLKIDQIDQILIDETKELNKIKTKLNEVINKLNESTYNKEINYNKIHNETKKVSQIMDTIFT